MLFISRIQEADGGFFENLGTRLAAKARAQVEIEGPIPTTTEEDPEKDAEGSDLEGSVEDPSEALLESDSDRDENEHTHNLIIDSVGWNVSGYSTKVLLCQISIREKPVQFYVEFFVWGIQVVNTCVFFTH